MGGMGLTESKNCVNTSVLLQGHNRWQLEDQLAVCNYIRSTGKISAIGARIPIPSNWNIKLFQSLAVSDADREVVTYLTYRWPLSHDGRTATSITTGNHGTAIVSTPFDSNVAVSPMSTRPKKELGKHRIIVDLS